MEKTCLVCRQGFEVREDDLVFYEAVSPVFAGRKELIPPPTLCPACRYQRRLVIRNERAWYDRDCDACGKRTVSIYSPDKPYVVYCQACWWSDSWQGTDFGRDFDFSRSAFGQFAELKRNVPRMALTHWHSENSEYTNQSDYNKDCYLLTSSSKNEKCCYGHWFQFSTSSFDCLLAEESELCYECVNVTKCYNSAYLRNSSTCSDSIFLHDCKGCTNCIGCWGLRNKEYHVLNQPVSKEQYQQVRAKLQGSHAAFSALREEFEKRSATLPRKDSFGFSTENSSGDYLQNTKDAVDCFNCRHVENLKHSQDAWNDIYHSQDLTEVCWMAHCYEVNGSTTDNKLVFSTQCEMCNDVYYGDLCLSCHDTFLCTGLRHKQYCVLNKQYTKEEYEELVPRIIAKMREDKEWGEFFPAALSPFGYNETVANEYYPLTWEEALDRGFPWSGYVSPVPKVEKIVQASQLPDNIKDIPDAILDWAIECEVSKKPFRIIRQELKFLREHGLPLPRLHPDQRHLDRMKLRNPRELFERKCAKCAKNIQTTYSPDRLEIVYCEECYLKEVY